MDEGAPPGPLLEVSHLKKYFPIRSTGVFRRTTGQVKAIDDISFTIDAGETLGLVGESGSGKTTVGRCIVRVLEPTSGDIRIVPSGLGGQDDARSAPYSKRAFRRDVQMIFQDPFSSLNPRMTVLENVGEALLNSGLARGKELEARVEEMLTLVGLKRQHLKRYPHSFSGGQRQRIGIARALAVGPKLVVADEPVSALDVSTQAQIMNLLIDLQDETGVAFLLISHDLSVVRHISHRVAVMYLGQMMELGETETLLAAPKHPYTEALLSAVPRVESKDRAERIIMSGEPPDPANPPTGCVFSTRCRFAEAICRVERPALKEVAPGHFASCHFSERLALRGVNTGSAGAGG